MKTEKRFDTPAPAKDALGRERRLFTAKDVKVRAAGDGEDDDKSIGFEGHAALFDSETLIRGWFNDWKEKIARGAFKKTIGEADVRFLINHDPNLLLARNKAKTLRLSEDTVGLFCDADMAPVSYAQDLAVSLERGDITQMSFAFEVIKEEWDYDEDPWIRTIQEVKLWDVSVVTYPAYTDTDASLRAVGLDVLCRSMGVTDEKTQQRLLRDLMSGDIESEIAPTLRAAGEALVSLSQTSEPAESHSWSPEDLATRHKALAARHGLRKESA